MEFIDSNEWIPIHTLPGYECCIEYYVNAIKVRSKALKGTIENVFLNLKLAKNWLS